MQKYVNRLIKCGYSPVDAYNMCVNYLKDFSILDLEMLISSIEERRKHVD